MGEVTQEEIDATRAKLRNALLVAARALFDFEGFAAFALGFDDGRLVVSAGTRQAVRELSGGMTEARARQVLGPWIKSNDVLGGPNWSWHPFEGQHFSTADDKSVHLSADELEAIAWWMRNKQVTT